MKAPTSANVRTATFPSVSGGLGILAAVLVAPSVFATPAIAADTAATGPAATAPAASQPTPPKAGDTVRRQVTVNGAVRSYLVHLPPTYDPRKPTPVVLTFHGAFMNGWMMGRLSGMSAKADEAGFVVVYPNGTGLGETSLFFNASADPQPGGPPDDVAFTAKLLDDLATVVAIDPKRVFATGMSNGGMMCHRLAAELSDRIAAVAPVAGTLALPAVHPKRPVPVIHFHGSADGIVPFAGPRGRTPPNMQFRSVPDTIAAWVEADGCPKTPTVEKLPDAADDGTTVTRTTYGPGTDGAEVVLIEVKEGGHTWPGRPPPAPYLGKSTSDVKAVDLAWDFFQKHPMK